MKKYANSLHIHLAMHISAVILPREVNAIEDTFASSNQPISMSRAGEKGGLDIDKRDVSSYGMGRRCPWRLELGSWLDRLGADSLKAI